MRKGLHKHKLLAALLTGALLFEQSALCGELAQPVIDEGRTIYGEDNRVDLFDSPTPRMAENADAVASLWEAQRVPCDPISKSCKLLTQNFSELVNLCAKERFKEQSLGAAGTGFLIAPDLLLTAGHAVRNQAYCDNMKIVFGFALPGYNSVTPSIVPIDEVYACAGIVDHFAPGESKPDATGVIDPREVLKLDYTLIRLDRAVTNHKPLELNLTDDIQAGTPLYVISHPFGLPLKIADNATVRSSINSAFFTSNLDTFVASSGAPVFNATTNKVEGILVRGGDDLVQDNNRKCVTMLTFTQNGGKGEDVIKLSALKDLLTSVLPVENKSQQIKKKLKNKIQKHRQKL